MRLLFAIILIALAGCTGKNGATHPSGSDIQALFGKGEKISFLTNNATTNKP